MITHKGTQPLSTKRLVLRRFSPEDAHDMYNNWAKDSRVTRYLTWPPHESEDATYELLTNWSKQYERPDYYQWAIVYGSEVIGSIAVVESNDIHEWAEIGYCIGCDYWNKGIMPEAAKAVIDYLFGEVGFNRISICHATKNPASGRVAQKCGLSYEGTMRQDFKSLRGEFLDLAIYAILKDDWRKSNQA